MEEILYWNIMRPGQVDADDIKLRNAEKTEIKQREYLAWLSQEGERRAVNREDMKMEDSRSALLGGYARKVRRETGEFYNSDDVAAAALARRTKEGSTMLQRMDNAVARRRNCRTIGGWGLGNNRKAVMMTGTSGDGLCVGRAEAIVEDIEGDDEEDGSDTKKKQKQKKQQQKFETKTISGVLVQSIGEELSDLYDSVGVHQGGPVHIEEIHLFSSSGEGDFTLSQLLFRHPNTTFGAPVALDCPVQHLIMRSDGCWCGIFVQWSRNVWTVHGLAKDGP